MPLSAMVIVRAASSLGALKRILSGHTYYVVALAFGSDGKPLAGGSSGNVAKLWDVAPMLALLATRGRTEDSRRATSHGWTTRPAHYRCGALSSSGSPATRR